MTGARRVMAEWDGHLDHMAARLSQQLSDGQARVLFRAATREAPGRLAAFAAGRQGLEDAPACELPGT